MVLLIRYRPPAQFERGRRYAKCLVDPRRLLQTVWY